MEEEKNKSEKEKGNNLLKVLICVIVFLVCFDIGYIVSDKLFKGEEKNKCDAPVEEQKAEQKEEVKVPELDTISVNLMNGEIYFLNNGDLYYFELTELESARYFIITHSGCLSDGSSEYCKGNSPYYNQKPVKVEGVSNVVRIKLFNGYKSGGESFQLYAITESGDAYEINEGKVGILAFTNVADMYGNSNNEVVVSYKDGTTKVSEYTYSNDV